jgi:hypothetical protein
MRRLKGHQKAFADQIGDIIGIGAASDGITGYRIDMASEEDGKSIRRPRR